MEEASSRDPADAALLSAADAAQALAEDAYELTPARLEARAATTAGAAAGLKTSLAPAAQGELDTQLVRLADAQASGDRAETALAAVEIYRLLSSAVRHAGKAPDAVRVLAYAGLRYNAGRRGDEPRWDDMSAAVAVARQQWVTLSPLVKDPALLGQMDKAIADMAAACARKDVKSASRAVRAEQDLVETLEAYFNKG